MIDDGHGFEPCILQETLSSIGAPAQLSKQNEFNTQEHGLSLKTAILRLGRTGVILSVKQD